MELPTRLQIRAITDSLETQQSYLFQCENEGTSHFHICLKVSDDNYLLLLLVTSQVEKRLKHRGENGTVVIIDSESMTCLTKQSCVDCNDPKYLTKEELEAQLVGDIKVIHTDIETSLILKIKDGIRKSPVVRPHIKKAIV